MRATREYERVEMDYGGLLEAFLKRVALLKYAAALALCYLLLRAFVKLADCLLAAPVETLIVFASLLTAAALIRKRAPAGVLSVLFLLAALYYPAQFLYVESRIFFFVFTILSLFAVDRGIKKNRSTPVISLTVLLIWIFAMNIAGMLWPVTVINSGNDVAIKEGVRRLQETALVAGSDEQVALRGSQANSLLLAADGRSLIAAYDGPALRGVASIPVNGGKPALFLKLGERGVKLMNIDPATGDVYAADMKSGVVYELDPDTLKLTRRVKLTSMPLPCGYVNSETSVIIAPDTARLQRRLKIFNYNKPGKPLVVKKCGGIADKIFPREKSPILPDVWSMSSIVADYVNRRYFITYKLSRYIVTISMEDFAVLKVDTDPAPVVSAAAIDTDHNTLFLASPLSGVIFYDTASLKAGRTVRAARGARAVAYDRSRDLVVAADYYGGDISFINRDTGKIVYNKFVASRINGIAVSPDGKYFISAAKGIYEIDPDKFVTGFKAPSTE